MEVAVEFLGSASYQNEQRASRPADSPNTSSQRGSTASPCDVDIEAGS